MLDFMSSPYAEIYRGPEAEQRQTVPSKRPDKVSAWLSRLKASLREPSSARLRAPYPAHWYL